MTGNNKIKKFRIFRVMVIAILCLGILTGCGESQVKETNQIVADVGSEIILEKKISLPDPSVYMGGVLKNPIYESNSFKHGFEVYDPDTAMLKSYIKLLTEQYGMMVKEQTDTRWILVHTQSQDQKLVIDVFGYDSDSGIASYGFTGNCKPIKAEVCANIPKQPAPRETTPPSDSGSGSGSNRQKPCNYCGGDGRCNNCGGSGEVWEYMPGRTDRAHVRCTQCNGGRCRVCGGDGVD